MQTIEKIEAFKQRTKQLSLRIIKLFQALPKPMKQELLVSNYYVQLHLLLPITEQHAGQDPMQNFLVKYLS